MALGLLGAVPGLLGLGHRCRAGEQARQQQGRQPEADHCRAGQNKAAFFIHGDS